MCSESSRVPSEPWELYVLVIVSWRAFNQNCSQLLQKSATLQVACILCTRMSSVCHCWRRGVSFLCSKMRKNGAKLANNSHFTAIMHVSRHPQLRVRRLYWSKASHMPLLTASSAFVLDRRRLGSPHWRHIMLSLYCRKYTSCELLQVGNWDIAVGSIMTYSVTSYLCTAFCRQEIFKSQEKQ